MAALLEGRTALVTGGTLGIGRGIAETLAAHGARVVVTGLTEDECADARARGATAHVLDVRDASACREVVERVAADLGGLSVLAANAGIYPQARVADMTDEDVDRIVDVNLKGTIHAVQAAVPALTASGRGRVVVTSSITGNLTGYPGWAHYGATKAAQLGFVRTAAIELARAGITVNAVLPGNVLTPGLRALGEDYMARMARSVPLGFLAEPEDIGAAVAFLASDGARYVTGQGLVVDGGQTLPESPEALAEL
ncbi:3-oxoacyl-ACP reductase FabG [Cellulomonas shaoxiangyii]|uniref:3-oxoacyl-ACP reductase FabG n=1 Tax=Cellulomonas shaoxiangyii TaxID=2566013 RepID=A0A4P7SEJ8_9CELL|nr:3-oxoacyl-ACP reductase FabG [Cellulomonas shaoxiangyii]QCB92260.1 3-oxoacyl-ACP reductase FabG [Cellulomonas shaoxiangyii]TGY85928.1 3-oxoacyl-ACP reductase FabG [Cellulomonas shaoxiangyii]